MSTPTKADARKPYRLAFSIKELAAALGANYYTVRRMISSGSIKSFQLNGEYRINLFEVARVLGVPAADLDQLLVDINAKAGEAS